MSSDKSAELSESKSDYSDREGDWVIAEEAEPDSETERPRGLRVRGSSRFAYSEALSDSSTPSSPSKHSEERERLDSETRLFAAAAAAASADFRARAALVLRRLELRAEEANSRMERILLRVKKTAEALRSSLSKAVREAAEALESFAARAEARGAKTRAGMAEKLAAESLDFMQKLEGEFSTGVARRLSNAMANLRENRIDSDVISSSDCLRSYLITPSFSLTQTRNLFESRTASEKTVASKFETLKKALFPPSEAKAPQLSRSCIDPSLAQRHKRDQRDIEMKLRAFDPFRFGHF